MKVISKLLLIVVMFTMFNGSPVHANVFSNCWAGLNNYSKCAVVGIGLVTVGGGLYTYGSSQSAKQEQHNTIDQERAFSQFIAKHYLRDKKLQKSLQDAATSNAVWYYYRDDCSIKVIPGVAVIKPLHDISRVINAERMRKFIKKNNLNLLSVPPKYFYKVGGRMQIVAPYVTKSKKNLKITLPLIKQLAMVAEEMGFVDWQRENWCFDEHGLFTFLDTEDRSFGSASYRGHRASCLGLLQFTLPMSLFDKEAIHWLNYRITQLYERNGGGYCVPLPHNTEFDDPAINIANVKQYKAKMGKLEWIWANFLEILLRGANSKRLYLMG